MKKKVIYMGDSFTDIKIFKLHIMRLQPMTVIDFKKYADFVTFHKGGNRAVTEAIFHIIKKI